MRRALEVVYLPWEEAREFLVNLNMRTPLDPLICVGHRDLDDDQLVSCAIVQEDREKSGGAKIVAAGMCGISSDSCQAEVMQHLWSSICYGMSHLGFLAVKDECGMLAHLSEDDISAETTLRISRPKAIYQDFPEDMRH